MIWEPSPELVEALSWLETMAHGRLGDIAVEVVLEAAVAYRTPTGDPELVPWEQVRELVAAARAAQEQVEWLVEHVAEDWAPEAEEGAAADLARLRAALAPFTQEPQP